MMRNYVSQIFLTASAQVATAKEQSAKMDDKSSSSSSDTAFAIYYGKFQASAPKAKRITAVIEERLDRSQEYEVLLAELHQTYLSQRANVNNFFFQFENDNFFLNCILRRLCALKWMWPFEI